MSGTLKSPLNNNFQENRRRRFDGITNNINQFIQIGFSRRVSCICNIHADRWHSRFPDQSLVPTISR